MTSAGGPRLDPSLIGSVAKKVGLSVPASRRMEIAVGIRKIMEMNGIACVDALLGRMSDDPDVLDAVIAEWTVQETYFFRDPLQFEAIRTIVLPSLLAARPPRASIRIWSAGCSSGEEPYSLAILMEEEGLGERAEITATDVSRTALKKGRAAKYGDWSLRDSAPGFEHRYFSRRGESLELDPHFRNRVSFGFLNLETDDFPSPANGTTDLDLILCRNVLMYFGKKTVRRIARRLFCCLAQGGWLVIGPSDPPLWEHAPFKTKITPAGVIYRRDGKPSVKPESHPVSEAPTRPEARGISSRPSASALLGADSARPPRRNTHETASFHPRACRHDRHSHHGPPCEAAAQLHPLSPERHYLNAVSLMAAGKNDEAAAALRRAIFLDGSLAASHFLLGTALEDRNVDAALRAFGNAASLCAGRPKGEPVPLSENYTAGSLEALSNQRIEALNLRRKGNS